MIAPRVHPSRWSLRTKLLGAFALDLILMFALGAFAIFQMNLMSNKAAFVEVHSFQYLRHVHSINSHLTRFRALQLEYIVHSNSADRTRILGEMEAQDAMMERVLEDLKRLSTSDQEQRFYEAFEGTWLEFTQAHWDRFIPDAAWSDQGTVHPALSRLNPLYEDLTRTADLLAMHSEQQATEALGLTRRAAESSRIFIVGGTVLALLISAVIGLILGTGLVWRLRQLTRAANKVASGDLTQRVEDAARDELGTLARDFNSMVDALFHQRRERDQDRRELQRHLDLQRELTRDLVRRKQAEAAANRARSAAESASQAKSLFLATMSHELRTPLNAILGYAQILELESKAEGRERPELGRILLAGRHLLTTISNILDFSKIEQGKMDLDITRFDIVQTVREVLEIAEPLAHEQDNRLHFETAAEAYEVRSDEAKIRQILFNLVSNAVKFTRGGTVTVRLSGPAALSGETAAESFAITVADTGIGIAPEAIVRLFEPFRQAETSTRRRYGGTGLGLAVTHQLCQLLNGRITVQSRVGEGSAFEIRLPADIDQPLSGSENTLIAWRTAS